MIQSHKIISYRAVETKEKLESLTLKWIKMTITGRTLNQEELQMQLESMSLQERETMAIFERLVFHRKYMHMLVLSEHLELITDVVFLKTGCPFILQPDSVVVKAWNYLVAVLALALAVVYPYFASFEPVQRVSEI